MIRRLIILFLSFIVFFEVQAQQLWVYEGLSPIETVDREVLSVQDNAKLQASVRSQGGDRGALKFAKSIDATLSIVNRGTWESIVGDRSVWRLRIKSPAAYSINIGLKEFYLPPSATMYISDIDQEYVIGPITAADNDDHREWWSPILPFDEVVIEVQVDTDEKDLLSMDIRKVNHDFMGFGALLSGSCNIDVACDADDGLSIVDQYRDIINSVGMYTINGVRICSGALINTTSNDCTPYFLTAFHCEVTANNAASVVVFWNYENSTCRPPNSAASGSNGNGRLTNFNSGSSLVSAYDVSDFTLLQLDDPVDPTFDPFYSGWNVDGEVFDTTFAIHHPRSEEKRISFDFDNSIPFVDQVFMRVDNWELGTTEGGSSGCPLYNTDKQIIGQLTGGLASCGNLDFDDFGMLKISWEGGGTPETRLKDWLDPINSGQLQIDGRSCISIASVTPSSVSLCKIDAQSAQVSLMVQSGYEDGASIFLRNVPEGVSATLSSDRLTTDQSVLLTFDISDLTLDFEGSIIVVLNDGFTEIENIISVDFDAAEPPLAELIAPMDGMRNINFDINFEWADIANSYNLQIARDIGFNDIISTIENLSDSQIKVSGLDAMNTYYWRVQSINECGTSAYTEAFSFTTGNIVCENFSYQGAPLTILTESNVVRSIITIDSELPIADIDLVNITGTHTWIADLEFRLIGPDGTVVDLLINGCESEDDFNVSFDDESDNVILNCPFVDGTAYRPRQELSVFDGQSPAGDWILEITDDVFLDGGIFDTWTLELCLINEDSPRSIIASPSSLDICPKQYEPVDILVNLNGSFDSFVTISIVDDQSNPVVDPMSVANDQSVRIRLEDISTIVESRSESIVVLISDERGEQSASIPIQIQVETLDAELTTPLDMEVSVDRNPVLKWVTSVDAIAHRIMLLDSIGTVLLDSIVMDVDSFLISDRLDQLTWYQWSVTSIGNCSPDQASDIFSFRTAMSVSTFDITESDISVYPNPVSDRLTIAKESKWQKDALFRLYSVDGVLIRSAPLSDSRNVLSTSEIPIGAYYYEIVDGLNRYIQRLIKVD